MSRFAAPIRTSSPPGAALRPDARKAQPRRSALAHQAGLWQAAQLKGRGRATDAAPQSTAAPDGLPPALKSGVETLSGLAMDDVRVHRNSPEPARLGALAYAKGSDIHLGPGQERHLPHEAWHVVQQKQGRVMATAQLKGVGVNDDALLEREADTMGARALVGASAPASSPPDLRSQGGGAEAPIQAMPARKRSAPGADPDPTPSKQTKSSASDEALLPESLLLLHRTVRDDVDNYDAWLSDDPTWAGRSASVLANLVTAKASLAKARTALDAALLAYPPVTLSRRKKTEYESDNKAAIAAEVSTIRGHLLDIDGLVTEPPPAQKTWDAFKGDTAKYLYADGAAKPIPVVFYKSEADYAPIVVPPGQMTAAGSYTFPTGPTVIGRLGTHHVRVKGSSRFGTGTVLTNDKDKNDRRVQVDINYALKQAGVSMAGKDGDHVRDLGFGGTDTADNYWPLKAEINRRPFLGWRGSYGINYYSTKDAAHKTASITALAGKKFKIESFMAQSDGNVPQVGVNPEPECGSIGPKPKPKRTAPKRKKPKGKRK